MENKETKSEEILEIRSYKELEGKTGRKFYSFETDKGKYSVFEFDIIDELKKHMNQKGEFEIAIRGNFKNIRKIIQWIGEEKAGSGSQPVQKTNNPNNFEQIVEARSMKDQSIYTSYAKDIFIALVEKDTNQDMKIDDYMQISIDLVKKARDSFK